MLRIYKTVDEELVVRDVLAEKGSWICLINPTEEELASVSEATGIAVDVFRYALDEEESARVEFEEDLALIIIRIPVIREQSHITLPLGVIITNDLIITVCLEPNALLEEFTSGASKSFYTFKKTRFLLQILLKTATLYLRYLSQIDKKADEIERLLHQSMKNEELIKLLELQKSLVYFTTSLKANQIVMEKLLRSPLSKDPKSADTPPRFIKMYEEDEELLEDVIIENKQAIEMGEVYTSILSSTMDAFASVISNNLNIAMKFLTSVTIVLAIPTMVASFFGMNVALPFQNAPLAFGGVVAFSVLLSLAAVLLLGKWKMF